MNNAYPNDPHKNRYPDPWEKPKHKSEYISVPKPLTINDLFPQFDRWAIGFDPLMQTLQDIGRTTKASSYPPYNVYKYDDSYVLELAVAGFKKDDITIEVQELTLTVEGRLEASEDQPIHKGIATRDFKQEFALAEYVVVKGAELKDGLLRITLAQELPEAKKSKLISIS